jgi:hypothetical protein
MGTGRSPGTGDLPREAGTNVLREATNLGGIYAPSGQIPGTSPRKAGTSLREAGTTPTVVCTFLAGVTPSSVEYKILLSNPHQTQILRPSLLLSFPLSGHTSPLSNSPTLQLPYYSTPLLSNSPTLQLPYSPTPVLSNSPPLQLPSSPTPLLSTPLLSNSPPLQACLRPYSVTTGTVSA